MSLRNEIFKSNNALKAGVLLYTPTLRTNKIKSYAGNPVSLLDGTSFQPNTRYVT